MRDDRIFEIKSTYILQPGPASLTDGVRQIHDVLRRVFSTKDAKETEAETDSLGGELAQRSE